MVSQETGSTHQTSYHAKIAIIGGGSLDCTGVIHSILTEPEVLQEATILLMDKDEQRLDLIFTIASSLFKQAGITITLEKTTNLEEAVADADFVLTTFRTGGLQARALDEKIPLTHNLIGQDTIGPGGFFYALRTAPILAGIAAEMEKVAPRAFLLNYTNPSNIVMEAIAQSSGIRVIGIDHRPQPEAFRLAQLAGITPEPGKRLYPRTVGLNHGNWTTAIWSDGEDVLPTVVQWCNDYINSKPELTAENYAHVLLATLTAHYKAIPSYYMHYYYFPEIVLKFLQQAQETQAERLLAQLPGLIARYQALAEKDHPDLAALRDHNGPGHLVLDIMRSIWNDTGEEWVLSVPNKGAINFLDDERVVELPCRVDARGATPLTLGDGGLQLDQRGLITALAEYEGATARAALWGNRRDAIKALAANPLVMSYSKAETLYDEMAAAHQAYLPSRLLK